MHLGSRSTLTSFFLLSIFGYSVCVCICVCKSGDAGVCALTRMCTWRPEGNPQVSFFRHCPPCFWRQSVYNDCIYLFIFCLVSQPDINRVTWKERTHLRNCFRQTGLWACLWDIFFDLMIHMGGPRPLWAVPSFGG